VVARLTVRRTKRRCSARAGAPARLLSRCLPTGPQISRTDAE